MYEFASGIINVLEKRVFDKLDQERMINAPDIKSAFSVLLDTDLGVASQKNNDIEEIIKDDLLVVRNTLSKILFDNEKLFWFLFLKYDALNIKIALKKKLSPESQIKVASFIFSIDKYEDVEKIVINSNQSGLPEVNKFVKQIIDLSLNSIDALEGKISSRQIEELVDKAYFKVKAIIACDLGKFMRKVVREELMQTKEKKQTNHLSEEIFSQARNVGMGPEKVLAFINKKLNGYNNIRLLLFAKKHNIDINEIKSHLLPL